MRTVLKATVRHLRALEPESHVPHALRVQAADGSELSLAGLRAGGWAVGPWANAADDAPPPRSKLRQALLWW